MILILQVINFLTYSNRNNMIVNRPQNRKQTQDYQILLIHKKKFNKVNLKFKFKFLKRIYKNQN